jgi:hypothetical protein
MAVLQVRCDAMNGLMRDFKGRFVSGKKTKSRTYP